MPCVRGLSLSFSHALTQSAGKDGGSLSLVGPFSKLSKRGWTVWRNCCCHVTIPWLRFARWASVWSNVCYGGWRRRIRRRRTQQEAARWVVSREGSTQLPSCLARRRRRLSRSLGQWGWETGLAYMQNDSQSFSLSYRPCDKAQRNTRFLFQTKWCVIS